MCLDMGRDFWCAYRGVWVAKSEFNSTGSHYHEPKDGVPYVAISWGPCECLNCPETDKAACHPICCEMPGKLEREQEERDRRAMHAFDKYGNLVGAPSDIHNRPTRCELCMAQYKINGKLR